MQGAGGELGEGGSVKVRVGVRRVSNSGEHRRNSQRPAGAARRAGRAHGCRGPRDGPPRGRYARPGRVPTPKMTGGRRRRWVIRRQHRIDRAQRGAPLWRGEGGGRGSWGGRERERAGGWAAVEVWEGERRAEEVRPGVWGGWERGEGGRGGGRAVAPASAVRCSVSSPAPRSNSATRCHVRELSNRTRRSRADARASRCAVGDHTKHLTPSACSHGRNLWRSVPSAACMSTCTEA